MSLETVEQQHQRQGQQPGSQIMQGSQSASCDAATHAPSLHRQAQLEAVCARTRPAALLQTLLQHLQGGVLLLRRSGKDDQEAGLYFHEHQLRHRPIVNGQPHQLCQCKCCTVARCATSRSIPLRF